MKRLIHTVFVCVILGALTACKTESLDIVLKQETYEIGSIESACEAVLSVNGKDIDAIEARQLIVDGQMIKCSGSGFDSLGETLLLFEKDNLKKEFVITLVDTTAPTIHFDQEEISVEVDNNYFNLKELIEVSDNFDKRIDLRVNGTFDITKPGSYPLTLLAQDISGNRTSQSLVVVVTEREKEIVTIIEEKPVYIDGGGNSSSGSSSGDSTTGNTNNTGSGNTSQRGPKPANKNYLFTDGYTIQSAPIACEADLRNASVSGWGGACRVLKGSEGYATGMELIIYD